MPIAQEIAFLRREVANGRSQCARDPLLEIAHAETRLDKTSGRARSSGVRAVADLQDIEVDPVDPVRQSLVDGQTLLPVHMKSNRQPGGTHAVLKGKPVVDPRNTIERPRQASWPCSTQSQHGKVASAPLADDHCELNGIDQRKSVRNRPEA